MDGDLTVIMGAVSTGESALPVHVPIHPLALVYSATVRAAGRVKLTSDKQLVYWRAHRRHEI